MGIEEFNKWCNAFNDIYKKYLGKDVDKSAFETKEKFRKIYTELSQNIHPDLYPDDSEKANDMQRINGIRDNLNINFYDRNVDIAAYYVVYSEEKKSPREYLELLKKKKDEYFDVSDLYQSLYDGFQLEVMFSKNSNSDYFFNEYKRVIQKLNKEMKKVTYINNKVEELEVFVLPLKKDEIYEDDPVNSWELSRFRACAYKCRELGEIDELFVTVFPVMEKRAFFVRCFNSLEEIRQGYPSEYFDRIYSSIESDIHSNPISEIKEDTKFLERYEKMMIDKVGIVQYYFELQKIMKNNKGANFEGIDISQLFNYPTLEKTEGAFLSLKEKIGNRNAFYRRVKAKLSGFIAKYSNKSEYSFTLPYIKQEAMKLHSYYDPSDKDLRNLDLKLSEIEKKIEIQKDIDITKASNKKDRLIKTFSKDFEDGILIGDGLDDIKDKINSIRTFGGFANFSNRILSLEMQRVLTSTGIYLRNSEKKFKKVEDGKFTYKKVVNALKLWGQFQKILDYTTDFKKIEVDPEKKVDYREFSSWLQKLNDIDFELDNPDELTYKLVQIDGFLNDEKNLRKIIKAVNDNHDKALGENIDPGRGRKK